MKIIFFSILILSFASCTVTTNTCEYFKTQSSNVKDTVAEGKNLYRYEDSLVVIDYNLWESGGQLMFRIYNKSDAPIYVDWNHSNFIYNGNNHDYYTEQQTINSQTKTTGGQSTDFFSNSSLVKTIGSNYTSVSNYNSLSNTISTVKYENPQTQIPPKSFNTIHKFDLAIPFFESDTSRKDLFTKLNSPLQFRNYLAISKSADYKNEIFIDNDFWISSLEINVNQVNDGSLCNFNPIASCFYLAATNYSQKQNDVRTMSKEDKKKATIKGCLIMSVAAIAILAIISQSGIK